MLVFVRAERCGCVHAWCNFKVLSVSLLSQVLWRAKLYVSVATCYVFPVCMSSCVHCTSEYEVLLVFRMFLSMHAFVLGCTRSELGCFEGL